MRFAATLWVAAEAMLLIVHFRHETIVGLTANGSVAFGDDTINFWAGARLAIEGRVADIFDFTKFHAFQVGVLGGPIHLYHYAYPPVAILLCLPLGLLSYGWAVAVWLLGGWLAFAATVRAAWPDSESRSVDPLLYALAVPAVLLNWYAGQTGTWTAALLGGGLMVMPRRPVLAGILLGALIAKPQMALLIPPALLAGREWKSLVACAATAAVLIAASVALFGTEIWWAFALREQVLRHWILEDGTGVWQLFTSVFVSVDHLVKSVTAAYVAQAVACLVALVLVLRVWSLPAPRDAKNAVLLMAGIFATPYVQVYDLVGATLVPLWLFRALPDDDAVRGTASLAFVPLLFAPILTPGLVRLAGANIGWVLLIPALWVSVQCCLRRSFTGGGTGRLDPVLTASR